MEKKDKDLGFIVTPWEVKGEVNYDKLIEKFGVEKLDKSLYETLPKPLHVTLRRGLFFAHRDFDKWINAWKNKETVSIVTGRGPSGYMHIGHLIPFYFVKWLQEVTKAYLIIPFSDDEKYLVKSEKSMKEIRNYTIDNLINILAVGFDPKLTRIVIDTEDTIIYSLAMLISKYVNYSTVRAVYGTKFKNIGWIFYPAMQAAHLLLPQVLLGKHYTVVPVAIDQDPHTRVCRDIAERFELYKPTTIISKFLPTLENPYGKMSSSNPDSIIWLTDSERDVYRKIMKYAFSGGQPTIEEHRKYGGNPWIDVSFLFLYYFFEEDDKKIEEIRENYQSGKMLTGELKRYASQKISEFLQEFQRKRKEIESNWKEEYEKFKLREEEKEKILDFVYSF